MYMAGGSNVLRARFGVAVPRSDIVAGGRKVSSMCAIVVSRSRRRRTTVVYEITSDVRLEIFCYTFHRDLANRVR